MGMAVEWDILPQIVAAAARIREHHLDRTSRCSEPEVLASPWNYHRGLRYNYSHSTMNRTAASPRMSNPAKQNRVLPATPCLGLEGQ